MTAKRPNVLLLTVDALRADRLSVYGYERPTTPTLERFARHATVCENAFTLGPFTQVACIQLFTSSRPLSYGGYDRGAVGRPDNLFKRFQEAGYHTSGLSTIHWVSPYYGYTDGLDEDVGLFLLNTVAGMAFNNMRDTIDAYHQGKITEADMLATATPVLRRFFENVNHYSDRFLAHGKTFKADYPDAKAVRDGYDYRKVKKVVANHRRAFERHPAAYIRDQLHRAPDPHEWIAADWRYSRTPGKLIGEAVSRLGNRILGVVSASRAVARANRFRMSIDAHAIADKIVRQLRDRSREKPFFIWAHFKDTHMPYVSGPGRHWYRHTPRYLEMLGYPPGLDPLATFAPRHPGTAEERATVSALYDAAIRSTDEAIGKILDTLDSLDLAGDTVVGICSDHGEELGEHGDYGHRIMHYEHNARIPMMFRHGRGEGRRIDSLVTTMDWAPTVADLAGIDPAPGLRLQRLGHPGIKTTQSNQGIGAAIEESQQIVRLRGLQISMAVEAVDLEPGGANESLEPTHEPAVVHESRNRGVGAVFQGIVVPDREGGRCVIAVEHRQVSAGPHDPERFPQRGLGARHVAKGRMEDHRIEIAVLERQRSCVALLEA